MRTRAVDPDILLPIASNTVGTAVVCGQWGGKWGRWGGGGFQCSQRPGSHAKCPPLLGRPLALQPQSSTTAPLLSVLHTEVPSDLFHQRILLLKTSLNITDVGHQK